MGSGYLWSWCLSSQLTIMCGGTAFLEVAKHLPVMGCGELISYFVLLAQIKVFPLFPFWFSPPPPCRGVSVYTWGDLPVSWGQTTAVVCAFSLYHHKSAVPAHANWFKTHTKDLSWSPFPSTSVSALMQEVFFSVAELPICLCWTSRCSIASFLHLY